MTTEGAAPLARMIHFKKGLKDFNMYMNEIGDAGMEVLAPALKDCR